MRSYDLAPTPPPTPSLLPHPGTHRKTEKERQVAEGRGGKNQIIRRRESLVLYGILQYSLAGGMVTCIMYIEAQLKVTTWSKILVGHTQVNRIYKYVYSTQVSVKVMYSFQKEWQKAIKP